MFSPAHILSFICVNLGGAAWGLSFACVDALVGLPLSLAAWVEGTMCLCVCWLATWASVLCGP